MLEVARRSLERAGLEGRAEIVGADLESNALTGLGSFDLVLCLHNVLGFVARPGVLVNQLGERLRPGGVLIAVAANLLHAICFSFLRGRIDEARRAWEVQEVRFSNGPALRVFDPESLKQLWSGEYSVRVSGFPVAVYPCPGDSVVRASDLIGGVLRESAAFDEILSIERALSSREANAVRGNNLLAVARRR